MPLEIFILVNFFLPSLLLAICSTWYWYIQDVIKLYFKNRDLECLDGSYLNYKSQGRIKYSLIRNLIIALLVYLLLLSWNYNAAKIFGTINILFLPSAFIFIYRTYYFIFTPGSRFESSRLPTKDLLIITFPTVEKCQAALTTEIRNAVCMITCWLAMISTLLGYTYPN